MKRDDDSDILRELDRQVRARGYTFLHVMADDSTGDMPLAYSVGLSQQGGYELLVSGAMSESELSMFIEGAAEWLANNDITPEDGMVLTGAFRQPVRLHALSDPKRSVHLTFAQRWAEFRDKRGPRHGYQILWSDPDGLFPGDDGYDQAIWSQPVLP
jgi:hypothetical protein